MNELLNTVLAVLRGLLRFRWVMLAAAAVISVAGWAFVYQMPDVYEGRARVFVDTNRVLGPLLSGLAVQPRVSQRVALMSRTLLNRPNIEKLIRTTDLGTEAVTELEREQLLDSVRNRISLRGTRNNESLYNVVYRDRERERARRVVQALLNVFIEETIGDKREDSESAQAFLDQQIAALERRLAEAEKRLSEFKRDNAGKTPGEAGGYYARLASAKTRAETARLELEEARKRRDLVASNLARETPTLRGDALSVASPTELKLAAHRNTLDELLVSYTERHPRVSQLRSTIAALEAQVARERASPRVERPGTVIASPAYQDMRAALTEAEARVAELEVRTDTYDRRVEELELTVESIPLVEKELKQLDRDYEIVRERYEALLQRRESARLSEQVEQNVDDIQFRIIDPPFVPVRPSAPNKALLSTIVFAGALGAGAALAFALSLMRPVYYAPADVASRTGRVPLGSVSAWRSAPERAAIRVSWLVYLGSFAALVATCALVVLMHRDAIDVAALSRLTGLPFGDWFAALGRFSERAVDTVLGLIGGDGA